MLAQAIVQTLANAAPFAFTDLQDFLFQSLAFRDVTHEPGKKPPVLKPHLAYRKIHRKRSAIFALANDFPANSNDPRMTRPRIVFEVAIMRLPVRTGHEGFDILSNNLVSLIPEDIFRGRIARLDRALLVYGNDSLHCGIKDGAQPRFTITQGGAVTSPFKGLFRRLQLRGGELGFQPPKSFDQCFPVKATVIRH